RSVGALFFGNYQLMDYELMGGDARAAIVAETGKRGMTPFLPPVVPFGSKQWPTLVTPGPGPATFAARIPELGVGGRHFAQPVAPGIGGSCRPAAARLPSGARELEPGRRW